MPMDAHNPSSREIPAPPRIPPSVTAIVPARNEEAVLAACIESLARQPEILEILVVNDQSIDGTASVVRKLMEKVPNLRLLESGELPDGWVGKNHALWTGAKQAKGAWLLFTDADAQHEPNSTASALQIAQQHHAALVSFSPEQITETWYEKALIPYIYLRLAKHFSYEKVNEANSAAAAANGQFLLMRRDVYDAIGIRAKSAGQRIWFGSGRGIVRARMYRSFVAMWQGWKKNLYRLTGGTPWAVLREAESCLPWIPLLLILAGLKYPLLLFLGVLVLIGRQTSYGLDLVRNHYPFSFIFYYVPAVALYIGVLWASYRSHVHGRIEWKGREYSLGAPESVK